MKRVLIKDIKDKIGGKVRLAGWVDVRRDHGKLVFIDLRDMSGKVQMVISPKIEKAFGVARELRPEWVIEVEGEVKKRPEKMVNPNVPFGDIEIELEAIRVLNKAVELPFEKEAKLNLETYLNYLPLALRDEKNKAIFKVQAVIAQSFREFFIQQGFVEIQVPKIIGEDAEGGAESFDFEYFGHKAHLAQSPQFYKQIMVGVFEKVFTVGNVYRAEKHSTTRHINEYTSLDVEMGFINDHTDIIEIETRMLKFIIENLNKECEKEFKLLSAEFPKIPDKIPVLKFKEAQEVIKKGYGEDCGEAIDLEPQHERWLSEYAKKKHNSDFIFITHFPLAKRPMYTYEDEKDPGFTKSFDLLFRGVEITTGGQRIHEYDKLAQAIKNKGLNPEKFNFYLQAFKYGMPPHGGFGIGLERLTAKMLGIDNIKEATLFPRDLNRIDILLSEQ
jgi:nondiscriminating aspartyl-tRNA synthetase